MSIPCRDTGLNRRALMLAGAGILAAAPYNSMARAQPAIAASTPDAALNLLMDGNVRYVANQPRERDFSAGAASEPGLFTKTWDQTKRYAPTPNPRGYTDMFISLCASTALAPGRLRTLRTREAILPAGACCRVANLTAQLPVVGRWMQPAAQKTARPRFK